MEKYSKHSFANSIDKNEQMFRIINEGDNHTKGAATPLIISLVKTYSVCCHTIIIITYINKNINDSYKYLLANSAISQRKKRIYK